MDKSVADAQSVRVVGRQRCRSGADVRCMDFAIRALPGDGQCDGATAGSQVRQSPLRACRYQFQCRLDQRFGFMPGDQYVRGYPQLERPELALARDVGDGFTIAAALDVLAKALGPFRG